MKERRLGKSLGWALLAVLAAALLGQDRAAAQSADPDAVARLQPAHAAAVRQLSAFTTWDGTSVDQLLSKAGFDQGQSALVPEWPSFSPVRKIETAVLSAQAVSPDNGDRFLALMSRQLAAQYQSASHDEVLGPYATAPASTEPVRFAGHARLAELQPLPDPRLRAVIKRVAEYTGERGNPSTVSLMRTIGVDSDTAYDILRRSRSSAEALERAVSRMPPAQHHDAVKHMVRRTAMSHATVMHDPLFVSFIHDSEARHPAMNVDLGKEGDPPRAGTGRPGNRDDPGRGPDQDPPPAAAATTRDPPGSPPGPGGGQGLAGGGTPGGGAGGGGSGERFRPASFHSSSGSSSVAGQRFEHFQTQRARAGMSTSFRSATSGGMRVRLGGVVFGNDVRSAGGERPAALAIGDEVQVVGQSGAWYTLKDVVPEEMCLALKMTATERKLGYGLAGLTDGMDDGGVDRARRFNVLLHPALVGTEMGRHAVDMDALPILMEQRLSVRQDVPAPLRERWTTLFTELQTLGAATWQVVDVETSVALEAGQVVVKPVDGLGSALVELRPVVESEREATFVLGWAARFRSQLETFGKYFPAYAAGDRFARTLAVARWARQQRAKLPAECSLPAKVGTPDAVKVCMHEIQAVPSFDRGELSCQRTYGAPSATADSELAASRAPSYALCRAQYTCAERAPLSNPTGGERRPDYACLKREARKICAGLATSSRGSCAADSASMVRVWKRANQAQSRSPHGGGKEAAHTPQVH